MISTSPGSPHKPNLEELLVEKIISEISQRYHLDLSQDPVAKERIFEAVKKAALDLKNQEEVEIHLPYISANPSGPIHLNRKVTRAEIREASPFTSESRSSQGVTQGKPVQRPKIRQPDRKPKVTTSLLVIMVIIYGLQIATEFFLKYDLPASIGMKSNELILQGQYWRLITAMFLHGSPLHLGVNMYALFILGGRVERLFGSLRFLGLFLLAGITGNLFSFLLTDAPSLGSSTAIFGLLGAEGVFIYQHRELFGDQSRVALRQIIQVAGINLLIGLYPGIDNWGHVGGLIGGSVFAWFGGPRFILQGTPPDLRLEDQRPEERTGFIFLTGLIVVICLAVLVMIIRS
jgi:membrane associated rhomboid family serine protease